MLQNDRICGRTVNSFEIVAAWREGLPIIKTHNLVILFGNESHITLSSLSNAHKHWFNLIHLVLFKLTKIIQIIFRFKLNNTKYILLLAPKTLLSENAIIFPVPFSINSYTVQQMKSQTLPLTPPHPLFLLTIQQLSYCFCKSGTFPLKPFHLPQL